MTFFDKTQRCALASHVGTLCVPFAQCAAHTPLALTRRSLHHKMMRSLQATRSAICLDHARTQIRMRYSRRIHKIRQTVLRTVVAPSPSGTLKRMKTMMKSLNCLILRNNSRHRKSRRLGISQVNNHLNLHPGTIRPPHPEVI